MPISKNVSDLIKDTVKLDIVQGLEETKYLTSLSLKQELHLYDQTFSAEQQKALTKKIKTLKKQLERFYDDEAQVRLDQAVGKLVIKSIYNLLSEIRSEANQSAQSPSTQNPISVSSISLPHVIPLQFSGVKTINADRDQFVFCLSQTIPPNLILRQKEWPQFHSDCEKEFVIAITNCPVIKPFSDRRVTKETLTNASEDDIEVLDVIHELMRMGYVFDLGVLTFVEPEKVEDVSSKRRTEKLVQNDYGLRESIIESCTNSENSKSLLIRIVAESKNLSHENSIGEILKRIPFEELAKSGVDHICLDTMSCNTLEIADSLTKELKALAEKLKIKISANFYDGYVQNNNSFCYINPDQEKILLETLEKRLESGEQNPTISYSSHQEKLSFPLIQDIHTKTATVLQVLFPGFSAIAAQDLETMEASFIKTKPLRGINGSHLQKQSSHDVATAEASETTPLTTRRITKKLMMPLAEGAQIPEGKIITWLADYRPKILEKATSSADPHASVEAGTAGQLADPKSASQSHC